MSTRTTVLSGAETAPDDRDAQAAAVAPRHIVYAVEETDDGEGVLLGIAVPAYGGRAGFGVEGVRIAPADWSRVSLVVHGVAPLGVPTLRSPDDDPANLESWVLPDVGTDRWDAHTREWATVETPGEARRSWHRLTLRAAHQERLLDVEDVDVDLIAEAVRRADRLGWRTISVSRLAAIAAGDRAHLPPEPPILARIGQGNAAGTVALS